MDVDGAVCIVGAGPSGLTCAKNLADWGIPFQVFERQDDVGGNWYFGSPHSSVYRSTHMISSKRMTEFTDYPMPAEYPPYPSHAQAWQYLRSYARHFGLYPRIAFETEITQITRERSGWLVRTSRSPQGEWFAGLIIANGHHWDPLIPQWPGKFAGRVVHSHDYKTPELLRGQRVLVVGGGNSGCDIAVEAALHAASVHHSLRRGYHFLPKFLLGSPTDACGDWLQRWRIPWWLYRRISEWTVRIAVGRPEKYGLPKPDHQLFETHPIINSQLLYYVGHGRIHIRPNVQKLDGNVVEFIDGTRETIDIVICATGYRIRFPFIDQDHLNWHDGHPRLFLNTFHPDCDDLFIAGLTQPNSGQWGLTDYQAQLIARFWVSQREHPRLAAWFRREKAKVRQNLSGGLRYLATPRHQLEVEYFHYRRLLRRYVRKFARCHPAPIGTGAPLPARTP